MLWVGLAFLVLLVIDIWHRPRTKHKTRSLICMIVEGAVAIGCFAQWIK